MVHVGRHIADEVYAALETRDECPCLMNVFPNMFDQVNRPETPDVM